MDSSKRQFLQQLGVLTAGASLVPLAEAKFPFSPERHEGSPRHRYAMLIDLRRCIGCQSCTVSCTIENQTPQGAFRTTVNQYQVSVAINSVESSQTTSSPLNCIKLIRLLLRRFSTHYATVAGSWG